MASESDSQHDRASSELKDLSKQANFGATPNVPNTLQAPLPKQGTTNFQTSSSPHNSHHGTPLRKLHPKLPPMGCFFISPRHQDILSQTPPTRAQKASHDTHILPSPIRVGPQASSLNTQTVCPGTFNHNLPRYGPIPAPPPFFGPHSGPFSVQNLSPELTISHQPHFGALPATPTASSSVYTGATPPLSINPANIGDGFLPPASRPYTSPAGTIMAPPISERVKANVASVIAKAARAKAAQQPSAPPSTSNFAGAQQGPHHQPPPALDFSIVPIPGPRRKNPVVFHSSSLGVLLEDIDRYYEYAQVAIKDNPRFMDVINTVMEHHVKNRGRKNIFYSEDHVKHGDSWLKWKVVENVKQIILIRLSHGDALCWDEAVLDEALTVLALCGELYDVFSSAAAKPGEKKSEKKTEKKHNKDKNKEKGQEKGQGKEIKKGKKIGDRILTIGELFPVPPMLEEYIEDSEWEDVSDDDEEPQVDPKVKVMANN